MGSIWNKKYWWVFNVTLLVDVFENFRVKCIEIYELDPIYFVSAPGLAWQACLKKADAELEVLTWYVIDDWRRHSRWNMPSSV